MKKIISNLIKLFILAAIPIFSLAQENKPQPQDVGSASLPYKNWTLKSPSVRQFSFKAQKPIKLQIKQAPPVQKIFYNTDNALTLIPLLYSEKQFFTKLKKLPRFAYNISDSKKFEFYQSGDIFVQLAPEYRLRSANLINKVLYLSVMDEDGDYVALDRRHLQVYDKNGRHIPIAKVHNLMKNISILVDRSGSMRGVDKQVQTALNIFSQSSLAGYYCALYEFSENVQTIQRPYGEQCSAVLQNYQLSPPEGKTKLYGAMDQAYHDIKASSKHGLSALVVISDGTPTDEAHLYKNIARNSQDIPMFVLWAGNFETNFLAKYSTAYAMSGQVTKDDLLAFLTGIVYSMDTHQAFQLDQ